MSLLRHEEYNSILQKFGYVRLPLISKNTVDGLIEAYLNKTEESFEGFHPTMFHKDAAYRKEMNALIMEALLEPFSKLFSKEYRLLYGNFMVKEANSPSTMKLHQDWTYVEDSKHPSYAVWIPLVDLTANNGPFSVIPKSHRLSNSIRGVGTSCPLQDHELELIEKFGKSLHLKAGEAVIWDHRLAHYSPPNSSNHPRIAITAIIVPKHSQVIHYFKDSNSKQVSQYEVDNQFFMNYSIGERPRLPQTKIFEESRLTLNMQDFETLLS